MANALYAKGKEKMLSGAINFAADTIKAVLVKNTYPQNLATDEFASALTAYRLNADQTLGTKSVAAGVFDAADVTFTAVTAGDTSEGIVLIKWVTTDADSPLLAYIDTITGFPLATNGGDITIQWDNGAYKVFSL